LAKGIESELAVTGTGRYYVEQKVWDRPERTIPKHFLAELLCAPGLPYEHR
jgi:hypothetical protein